MLKEKLIDKFILSIWFVPLFCIFTSVTILSITVITQSSYDYEIKVGVDYYYCNEYIEEFNKLYLEDCSSEDTIIHNPVNYRIEER